MNLGREWRVEDRERRRGTAGCRPAPRDLRLQFVDAPVGVAHMKYSIACLLLAVSIATPVFADTVKIPEDKPVAVITFPEGWTASVSGDMITAAADDASVLINVITTRPDMLGPSNDKAFALLKIKPDFESYKDSKTTLNGMNVVVVNVNGKDASGGTLKVTLTAVEVTKDKGVMVIVRGEEVAKRGDEITAIMNSIAAAQ